MHICFLTNEYPKKNLNNGGIGSFVQFISRELILRGIEVSVVGINNSLIEEYTEDFGVKIYRISKSKWKFGKFYQNTKRILNKINSINKNSKIDIVEGSELNFAFFPKKTNFKKVIRLHGGHHFFAKELNNKINLWKSYQEKKSFKKADKFVAVSDYVGNQTKKHLKLNFQFETIYNTVDLIKFNKNNSIEVVKNSLLFVGTICEKKGIRQLVKSIPLIKKQFPDIQLNIIGRDWKFNGGKSYLEYLKTFILEEDKNNIDFLGAVPHSEISDYIAKTDICVYPSHMEAMPIAWLEGLAMGKKVVASKIGPGLELIKNNKTGVLFNPFSPEDIAEKIIDVLLNPIEAEKRALRARKDISIRFNPLKIIDDNINFYMTTLK